MKKQYIQPVLVAIELTYTTALMAGSGSLGVASGTIDAGDALGHDDDNEW